MLCYEITVNGKPICLAGHKDAVSLQASVYAAKEMEQPELVVSALVRVGDKTSEDVRWAKTSLDVGSNVGIRIIESLNPNVPETRATFGTRLHSDGTSELLCSFCGRSENEVQALIQGETANICLECAETTVDALREKLLKS